LIKQVLGHSDGSVTAIYNRYGYVKEMRARLGSLGARAYKVTRIPAGCEGPCGNVWTDCRTFLLSHIDGHSIRWHHLRRIKRSIRLFLEPIGGRDSELRCVET